MTKFSIIGIFLTLTILLTTVSGATVGSSVTSQQTGTPQGGIISSSITTHQIGGYDEPNNGGGGHFVVTNTGPGGITEVQHGTLTPGQANAAAANVADLASRFGGFGGGFF